MGVDNFKKNRVWDSPASRQHHNFIKVNYQTSEQSLQLNKCITLNIEAGTLLSILELCRSWQFYLTCLEGCSLFEAFVPAHTSKLPLSTSRAMNQHSFVPIQSELAQKYSYKQTVQLVWAHIRVEREENEERRNERRMLCSQTHKEAEATQVGNAPFSSQPDEANQVSINLREDSLIRIFLHNKSERYATVGNKTMLGGSASNFCRANASSLLPLNM